MSTSSTPDVLDRKSVAAHLLVHLARAQAKGRLVRLDELAVEIGVRRTDIREMMGRLHAEGHVDAARMKLTLSGLALASAMRSSKLREVRKQRPAAKTIAAA